MLESKQRCWAKLQAEDSEMLHFFSKQIGKGNFHRMLMSKCENLYFLSVLLAYGLFSEIAFHFVIKQCFFQ